MFFDQKGSLREFSLKTENRQKSGHVPDFWLIARVGAVSAARAKTLELKENASEMSFLFESVDFIDTLKAERITRSAFIISLSANLKLDLCSRRRPL